MHVRDSYGSSADRPGSTDRILRPLWEAGPELRLLDAYRDADELARAVGAVWAAVEHSLRLLLREDTTAPDPVRLAALAPDELPLPRLLETLRARDRITIELAGTAHDLGRAAERAARGEVRAADADLARAAVALLEAEVAAREPETEAGAVAIAGPPHTPGPPPEPVPAVPPDRWRGARALRITAAVIALLALATSVFVLFRALDDQMSEGLAAFRRGDLEAAVAHFEAVVDEAPRNVTARLYLSRVLRRQGEYEAAAEHLRAAARISPTDADVRRELGHLFMDLDRPRSAAAQYRQALEAEPGDERAWIGLVLALRAAGDPEAEIVLRRAPPGARAALTRD